MTVRVRPGAADDLDEVVAIYNHYVRRSPATFEIEPVAPEERRPWLEEHGHGGPHRLLVTEDDRERQLLGWATTSRFRPRAAYSTTVESSVYCRPDAAGRGIGTRLYRTLFRAIRDEDVARIVAGVTLPHPAREALDRRVGFRPVGTFTRVGRKFGRYWDVAWFERPRVLGEVDGRDASAVREPIGGPAASDSGRAPEVSAALAPGPPNSSYGPRPGRD